MKNFFPLQKTKKARFNEHIKLKVFLNGCILAVYVVIQVF